jgi:hypothetical protein
MHCSTLMRSPGSFHHDDRVLSTIYQWHAQAVSIGTTSNCLLCRCPKLVTPSAPAILDDCLLLESGCHKENRFGAEGRKIKCEMWEVLRRSPSPRCMPRVRSSHLHLHGLSDNTEILSVVDLPSRHTAPEIATLH